MSRRFPRCDQSRSERSSDGSRLPRSRLRASSAESPLCAVDSSASRLCRSHCFKQSCTEDPPTIPAPASALARPPPQDVSARRDPRLIACRAIACRAIACRAIACRALACRATACRAIACRPTACRGTGLGCSRGSVARGDIARHLIRQLRTRESPTTARTHASMDDFCLVTIRRQNR